MTRRAWMGVFAINLGILVATSPASYDASDATDAVAISLSPEAPVLYVETAIDAGQAYDWLDLELSFDGFNAAPASGEIALWVLEEGQDAPEEGAEPLDVFTIDARVGQAHPVVFELSAGVAREAFGPQHLMLSLEGEAVLEGEVIASVYASTSDRKAEGQWVSVEDLDVSEGVAP